MEWQQKIANAHSLIAPHVRQTPVLSAKLTELSKPVSLKFEHMQHTGSFKVRGAFHTLLSEPVPGAGVVAASGGNHGAAVAYAARELGHKAQIYVPEISNPEKIDIIRRTNADLEIVPGTYSNALERALAWERQSGAMQVHAYDRAPTVIGQGTCFAEWDDQCDGFDTLIVAVGGGGLLSGAMGWFGLDKRYVAVETLGCPALAEALNVGERVNVDVSGCAADALGARQIGEICFDMVQRHDVCSVLVSDENVRTAQRYLWDEFRQFVEPAGAVALSALLSGAYEPAPDERVGVLVCGANVPDCVETLGATDFEVWLGF